MFLKKKKKKKAMLLTSKLEGGYKFHNIIKILYDRKCTQSNTGTQTKLTFPQKGRLRKVRVKSEGIAAWDMGSGIGLALIECVSLCFQVVGK